MKRFLLGLVLLLALCVKSPAPTVNFASPPFDITQFIVNQPGNFLGIRYPGITNINYIPGTTAYVSNQQAYLGTNNFSGGGGGGVGTLTNGLYTNAGPADTYTLGGTLFLKTNTFGGGSGSGTGTTNLAFTNSSVPSVVGQNGFLPNYTNIPNTFLSNQTFNSNISWGGTATGNGSGITTLNAGNLSSGTVPTAQLGGGTANGLTFLNGSQNWELVVTNVVATNAGPQVLVINDIAYLNTNAFGGGGGGITALTKDVTASGSGSVAATVVGLNGTLLSSLQSGVMLNTFSTGVPSTVSSWPSLAAQLSSLIPQSALGSGSGGTGNKFLSDAQTYTTIPGAGFSNQLSSAVQHLAFNYVTNINTSTSVNGQAVGDMNGDGLSDIVVDTANATKVFTNYAGGQVFPLASSFAQTSVSGGVTLADVNGDGRLDAIASSRSGSYWNVLTNDGNGNLAQLNTNYTFTSSPNFVALYAAKVDNNSSIDVFRINGTDTIAIYTNDGTGIFVLSTNLPSIWNTTAALAVGDLNGDGSTDFVMADPSAYTGGLFGFVTMTNNGNGVFSYYTTNETSGSSGTYAVAIADFNGDGKNDIAVTMIAPATQVVVYTNSGTAFFPWSTNVMNVASSGSKLITGDFNSDGRVDLMASSISGDAIYCWTNNGKGLFPAFTNTFGISLDWIGTGDFNGDGWPDWDAYDVAGNIQVYLNTPNIVGNFVGNGTSVTNGNTLVTYSSSVVANGSAWVPGSANFGTLTVDTNYLPLVQTSAATSGTVTATTGNPIQTTYLSAGSTISTITWALPTSSTITGRINYLHSKSAITTLAVTGGSFVDAAVTAMTAGQTIGFQVVDGSGTYIRLQ